MSEIWKPSALPPKPNFRRTPDSRDPIKIRLPTPQLRLRLNVTLVSERRFPRPQHVAHRIARDPQIARDLPDRLALDKMLAPYSAHRLHNQHPPTPAPAQSRQPNNPGSGGSIFHAETHSR